MPADSVKTSADAMKTSYFGNMVKRRRTPSPRPYRIEHRAVDPQLIAECGEWAEWHLYAAYGSEELRAAAMGQLLKASSGRWEYRASAVAEVAK